MKSTITRRDFISKLMTDGGLEYDQACRAYTCFVSIIEDGIVNAAKIGFGRVGAISPFVRPPRAVAMNFRKKDGERTQKRFHLDERVEWTFKVFSVFARRHHLR